MREDFLSFERIDHARDIGIRTAPKFHQLHGDEVELLRNEMFFYFFSEQIFETHDDDDDDDLVYPVTVTGYAMQPFSKLESGI